jgi:hypothetical protein
MKPFLPRLAFFATPLLGFVAPGFATPEKGLVVAFRSSSETITQPLFGRGMPAAEVLRLLGEPDERIAPGVWVYWNYQTNRMSLNTQGLDTLVIAISRETVVGLKIVPHQSLAPFVARLPAPNPTQALAAK